MPSAPKAYDDENMYKKLTVKELNQYAGSNRVCSRYILNRKLYITNVKLLKV